MKLSFKDNSMDLCEIDQESKMKFAFCKSIGDHVEVFHEPFKCRDFMNEVIVSQHLQHNFGPIWGFSLDYKNYPINLEIT